MKNSRETPIVKKALNVAYDLHNGQIRKIDKAPYIVHPLEVFSIVSRFSDKEEVLAASLLHDAIEDADYTEKQMLEDFGEETTKIVKLLTEDKTLSWEQRKSKYIENLRNLENKDAILVSAADKINNLQSMIDTYKNVGDKIWNMFNASKESQIKFYEMYFSALNDFLPKEVKERIEELIDRLREIINATTSTDIEEYIRNNKDICIRDTIYGHEKYDYDDDILQIYEDKSKPE